MRPEFEPVALVLLQRPVDAPELADEAAEALQDAHIAHLQSLRERGILVASGPFSDQPDDSWRGLCLLRTGPDDARRLFDDDPLVRRGRLVAVALTWNVRKGDIPSGRPE